MNLANRRPLSITIMGWVLIAFGLTVLVAHLASPGKAGSGEGLDEFKSEHPFQYALMLASPFINAGCGLFLLRGYDWARWFFIVWFGGHVVIGALNSVLQLTVHGAFFAVTVYLLLRRPATAYFRQPAAQRPG